MQEQTVRPESLRAKDANGPAHIIGHITIKDPGKWAKYCAGVPATLVEWGGQVVLRGRQFTVLSGEHSATHTVVIRFPDTASIRAWYDSNAYQALIPLRTEAAEVVIVGYAS